MSGGAGLTPSIPRRWHEDDGRDPVVCHKRQSLDESPRQSPPDSRNATWVEVQARDPFRDLERDSELKTAINQKLWALARDGVTDPVELREWALESLRLR